MLLSMRISPYLPSLRRYARAVTGSQTSGDAYVAAVLEALVADVSIFPESASDRVSIFKLFCSLFSSINITVPGGEDAVAWEKRAATNLAAIPTQPRQAFLLHAVEQFEFHEIAVILDVHTEKVPALIEEASTQISRQVATEIMIIEDEPLVAMDIEHMVQTLGHTVTGIATTRDEAVELFHRTMPKMILADIQLADNSSGVDAVNDILKSFMVPVIFITAFPEKLLTGERPEPTFLVTKPFNPDMVKALISQALFFDEASKKAA